MKLAVVMPAYQAGRHLSDVVARVLAAPYSGLERLFIVDDGSSDNTAEVAARLESAHSAVVLVRRPHNGGYGAAMKDGLRASVTSGCNTVGCVHADGQYEPEALAGLLATMSSRSLDLLQGSRIASGTARSGGMPRYKIVANAILNRLENWTLGLGLTDYHSGYILYGEKALRRIPFDSLSNSFDFDLEVIASARARGLSVGEEPVPTHYGDEVSHLQPVTYGLRVLRVLWRFRRGTYHPR